MPDIPARLPDHVPEEWVARYGEDRSGGVDPDPVSDALDHVHRAAARDGWALTFVASVCLLVFAVGVVWVVLPARWGGSAASLLTVVGLLAAFGACLWLIRRARRRPR